MLSSEVLPAPFGPMIEVRLPRRTASETSSTARTPPKCLETPETVSSMSPSATTGELLDALDTARISSPLANPTMPSNYGRHDEDAKPEMQSLPRTFFTYSPGTCRRNRRPCGKRGRIACKLKHAINDAGTEDLARGGGVVRGGARRLPEPGADPCANTVDRGPRSPDRRNPALYADLSFRSRRTRFAAAATGPE